MVAFKYLYKTFDIFKQNLKNVGFDLFSNCIVEIYTANLSKEDAVCVAKSVKQLLPNSQIFGISACGVIYGGEQYDDDTLIIVKKYESTLTSVSTFKWENKSAMVLVNEIVKSFNDSNPKMLNIVFSDNYNDIYDFVEQFNVAVPKIKLFGGVAGDILSQEISGYVFTDEGIIEKGVIINTICADTVNTYCASNIATEAISPVYTVTKTSGVFWDTIDDILATEWVKEHFGIYDMMEYEDYESTATNDPFAKLQVLLEGHNGAGRFLKFDKTENKISGYYSKVPAGTEFKIGYLSSRRCVEICYEICNDIMKTPIEDLFSYSCVFRKKYHENSAKWELSPFKNYNICGAFLLGEIGIINGRNEYLNGSSVLSGVAEKESYIVPDMTVFENLHNIEDENSKILNFVLKKQNKSMTSQNQILQDNLEAHQKATEKQLYIDPNIGVRNFTKYQEDVDIYTFNKLCLINIINTEALINYLGYDVYYSVIKEQYAITHKYMKSCGYTTSIHPYIVNNATFALAANSEIDKLSFLKIIEDVYDQFQFIPIKNTAIPIITRFVVCLNDDNLLETALTTLDSNENSQLRYILCAKNSNQKNASHKELLMLTILNRALENYGIVPYYQGIYDNNKKCIMKYEALMRIVDSDGTVYSPNHFMDIAKKYHMYELISWRMIECVFKDFENKNAAISVSINLSAYDINGKSFRKKLFKKLATVKNPSSFIFEILESEEFRDLTVLKEFVSDVRTYNVQIAIDDFGSGYSNLLEIAKIAPEYIKIDGGIVKNVHINDNNKLILETIVYLAKKIGASVIAEYVENENIYAHISAVKIDYSQGYYFAKPLPLAKLNLKEEND